MKTVYRWGSYALFLTGIIFFVLGRLRGEHLVVMKKAVNICLECIGIG